MKPGTGAGERAFAGLQKVRSRAFFLRVRDSGIIEGFEFTKSAFLAMPEAFSKTAPTSSGRFVVKDPKPVRPLREWRCDC